MATMTDKTQTLRKQNFKMHLHCSSFCDLESNQWYFINRDFLNINIIACIMCHISLWAKCVVTPLLSSPTNNLHSSLNLPYLHFSQLPCYSLLLGSHPISFFFLGYIALRLCLLCQFPLRLSFPHSTLLCFSLCYVLLMPLRPASLCQFSLAWQ